MELPFKHGRGKRRPGRGGIWMPTVPERGMSAERERLLEVDDLAQLLAATNAKRAARGKPHLDAGDVELRVWAVEQEMRRGPEA